MQIEPATCPACGAAYDPLRAQAVTVIDGRVRAFCSVACRERGIAPPSAPTPSISDAHAPIAVPPASFWRSLPTEQKVLIAAAATTLAAFVLLLVVGRHSQAASSSAAPLRAAGVGARSGGGPSAPASAETDAWVQPLAGVPRRVTAREQRLFFGRDGLPASECGGGRCAVDIDGAPGTIVMAVHDGVVEAVERDPEPSQGGGQEGRLIRINHNGGAIASSYLQLDGIREDLRPGIPVKMGEPIGTVARGAGSSSHAHIRFAISVRDAADGSVLFIDPQPLLALWPIRQRAPTSLRAMERSSPASSLTAAHEVQPRARPAHDDTQPTK